MLPDHYEYLVRKSRQLELIEQVRQDRLVSKMARTRTHTKLLTRLTRVACRLHLPAWRNASCAPYARHAS